MDFYADKNKCAARFFVFLNRERQRAKKAFADEPPNYLKVEEKDLVFDETRISLEWIIRYE